VIGEVDDHRHAGEQNHDRPTDREPGELAKVSQWRRDSFDPAVEKAGLALTPHELRGTAASLLIDTGASVRTRSSCSGTMTNDDDPPICARPSRTIPLT